ncbi:SRPBCC family protein [Williamsia phyllosphaerae]|uniref:Polyketide cyclase n=1 Tax=Williamsia phyllosphaerae TaxID=885042 RepID=A0ABQ1U366_9NOCA|nr:SRPBCC family protein [Williamsia phyllosphaerae]GGF09557.1 polyketide cyclase [Williamsia phyllosphaerae]
MAAPLIEASTDIKASPEKVWSIVSDLARMGEWSPQCRKIIVRGGAVGQGTKTINVNKRGLLVWPTTSKVVTFEPNREIAYRITENHTVWGFEITPSADGVTLTERRVAADGKTTAVSALLVDKVLGGKDNFEIELEEGIKETLAKIKAAAERA